MKAGQRQAPHLRGRGKAVRIDCRARPEARDCFEACAHRQGLTLSAWLLAAATERAIAEGGDPERGAP